MVTAWVRRALFWRLGSYRYALERLVVAVPSGLAVEAERTLRRFEAQVVQAEAPLAHCAGDGAYALVTDVPVAQPPATDAPVRPLVTK